MQWLFFVVSVQSIAMKYIKPLVLTLITLALVILLNTKLGDAPPVGKFLDPFHGFWQNAEPVGKYKAQDISLPQLKGKVEVYYDDRLVPHILQRMMKTCILCRAILPPSTGCGKWIFKFTQPAAACANW